MFSLGVAQLNVVKRDFVTTKDRRILPTSTTIIKQRAPSSAACASLCSIHRACCSASFDRKSKQCNLDESCCPKSESSEDALMLKISTDVTQCGIQNNEMLPIFAKHFKIHIKQFFCGANFQIFENPKPNDTIKLTDKIQKDQKSYQRLEINN
ncbi:unnamed protein product [Mytilus coruscus]|uniref:Apple domain-containing protein n=1 Tax=Mytilus coruscus TaxID=42192 RepID=A0A6J8CB09_MYTCO|nr:unnamed protein product [Mytilus coruscus]